MFAYVIEYAPAVIETHQLFALFQCSRDDYFSVHIRTAGDWTKNLANVLRVGERIEDISSLPT